jgi:Holliday junction resolvasome RuvABC endonuclease subunit
MASSNHVKVLGLDGSLANFGMVVATVDWNEKTVVSVDELILSKTEKDKAKTTKRSDDDFKRFGQHWFTINSLINSHQVSYVIGEIPSGAQDARASFAFGGVTAILAGIDQGLDVPVITVTPREAKEATGNKHADKEDVIKWAYELFPDTNWIVSPRVNALNLQTKSGKYLTLANEHLADGVAIIYAGLKKK